MMGGASGALRRRLDRLAIGISSLCLVHCVLTPLAVLFLPALGAFLLVPELLHTWALVLVVPTSALAMYGGYRHHRRVGPLLLALIGLALLVGTGTSLHAERVELPLTMLGSILLVCGHLLNLRVQRS